MENLNKIQKANRQISPEGMIAEIGSLTARLHYALALLERKELENEHLRERLAER